MLNIPWRRESSTWKLGGWLPIVALMLFFCSVPVRAQVATTGKITGVVNDVSGAAVPGATVTAKSPALMTPRTTQTQTDGSYLFDLLPPGTYEISVAVTGFKTFVQPGIVITSGFTATVNAKLEVGQIQQTVTVSGAGPVVDIKSTESSTTFDLQLLQNIPSGRDPWSTVSQAPGVTSSTFDVGGNQSYQQSSLQIHGSTPGEQVYSFNGLDLNWPGASGGYTQFYIDHDQLQEFQVVTDSANASVGIGGIYMNMVTKSGSNQVHGLAAIYYNTAALQAASKLPTFNNQPIDAGSPMVMNRDTTVNAGGPLIRDRWWLFGAYRRYDLRQDILAVRKQNGQPINDINHQTNTALRSDYQLNSKNRFGFVWLYNAQNRFFRRDTSFSFVSDQASWLQIEPAYILEGLWTSQITNNFLLDFRFGYNHILFPLGYQPTVGASDFNRQDVTLSTEAGAAPYAFLNPAQVTKFAVSASWYKGSLGGTHNFKFGYEVGNNRNGYFYDVINGINAVYNNGAPFYVTAYNTPDRVWSIFHDTNVFAQDSWTIKQRLTLNLGLRFDHFRTFYPAQDSPDAFFPQIFTGTRSFSQGPDLANWNNFSPRVGMALDITGHGTSVLRASYGRFQLIEGTELAEALNPNGLAGSGYLWSDTNNDGIPQTSEWFDPQNLIFSFGGVFTRVDPNIKRPYSDEVSVGYEQQIWGDLRVGATYYYRTKKNLIGQRNMAILPGDYTAVTTLNGQPITNPITGGSMTLFNVDPAKVGASDLLITNIPELDDNAYHGVEFTAIKRFAHKWQLLAGFTVQRQKGVYGRGGNDRALSDDFNDPNLDINRRDNYLNFDSTYVFKLDGTYNMPWGFISSVNFQHYTGYPLQPVQVFSGLNQGTETVILQPAGVLRLPGINLLNIRIAREFTVVEGKLRIEPLVDLFNLTNAQTVNSQVATFGPNYLRPVDVINPFMAKFGLRVTF
jgi:hypothetical protein